MVLKDKIRYLLKICPTLNKRDQLHPLKALGLKLIATETAETVHGIAKEIFCVDSIVFVGVKPITQHFANNNETSLNSS